MPLCRNCAQAFEDSAAICPNCGEPAKPPTRTEFLVSKALDIPVGSGLGCLVAVGLVALDLSLVANLSNVWSNGSAAVPLVLNIGALVFVIWFAIWASRRGMPQLLRAALYTFTWIAAIGLGLLAACLSMV